MPRKRRIEKNRIAARLESLSLADIRLIQHGGETGHNDRDYIQSLDDLKAIWERFADAFMVMADNPRHRTAYSYRPGTRPWAWWKWSAPGQPRQGEREADALERLGLINQRERELMKADRIAWGGGEWDGECFRLLLIDYGKRPMPPNPAAMN